MCQIPALELMFHQGKLHIIYLIYDNNELVTHLLLTCHTLTCHCISALNLASQFNLDNLTIYAKQEPTDEVSEHGSES